MSDGAKRAIIIGIAFVAIIVALLLPMNDRLANAPYRLVSALVIFLVVVGGSKLLKRRD